TSNIAGKVTMIFEKGYNTFSLPLEPYGNIRASQFLSHNVFTKESDTVYRYDTRFQQWMGHPKFLPSSMDDFTLKMGEGYMLFIAESQVIYTFTGTTGTSVRYMEGVGDEPEFRNSLKVGMEGNQVELSWTSAVGASGYVIYRATARMGIESLTDYEIEPVAKVTGQVVTWTDSEALGDEYYYMVVAELNGREYSGTYALGLATNSLNAEYSSFSFALEPRPKQTIASFTRESLFVDSDTIYYYDRNTRDWQGHPRFLPENINTGNVVMGEGYMIFTHTGATELVIIGI
ncbi:MAG: hypothetical protein JSV56_10145, partial [Methanomassiliicoccales archaeon]